jgi:predicted peptidase
MKKIVGSSMRTLALFCLIMSVIAASARAADVNEFIDFSLTGSSGVLLPGRLYVPPEAIADPSQPRPLITFLHGGGEAGTNNVAQLHPNIDGIFAEAKRRGAFLYAPQAPLNWRPPSVTHRVATMLDSALANFNVDPDRLYLMGYSSGGGGVWNMLSRYTGRFAASVAVAPVNPEPDFNPANLVGQPIAAFHARNDAVVSVGTTRTVINRILSAAGEPLPTYPSPFDANPLFAVNISELDFSYLEPAQGGHGVHFSVFSTPQMYDWLFSHGAPVPEPRSLISGGLALLATSAAARRRTRLIGSTTQ